MGDDDRDEEEEDYGDDSNVEGEIGSNEGYD